MHDTKLDKEYVQWVYDIKQQFRNAQINISSLKLQQVAAEIKETASEEKLQQVVAEIPFRRYSDLSIGDLILR